ncbi:hypothetical protein E1301_Tti022648 [Triplophysa tibetana]|uniref:Tankyrase 1-binding protein C-terminal domain-containing protein n=1 Tax=Triplophysa tibetana TaxID=1572043 RepID=A0A5A9P8I6_9TELE|nr:hypothetical protein E1301_Tti022648 [Triplophysa tibetana]
MERGVSRDSAGLQAGEEGQWRTAFVGFVKLRLSPSLGKWKLNTPHRRSGYLVQCVAMAAWVEASTRDLSPSAALISQSKTSLSASLLSGDAGKPALAPKPRLMPKPFAFQRNASIRPIKAPKITSARQLQRAASSDALDSLVSSKSELVETRVQKTSKSVKPNGTLKVSVKSASTKPAPLGPKPALTPKTDLGQNPDTTRTAPNIKPEDKSFQSRARAKSLGSQEHKAHRQTPEGESRSGDTDFRASSLCWPVRNRLSVGLTSRFESSEREVGSVSRDEPPLSPSASKPQEEEETGGTSIKRRISLLFDRSAASQHRDVFIKKDSAPAEISVDIKQRIKNLSLNTQEPRVRLPSTGDLKCLPHEKTQSDSDQSSPLQNAPDKTTASDNNVSRKNSTLSSADEEEEEDDAADEDKENCVSVPLYRRVGMAGMAKDPERKTQEEEKQHKNEQLQKEREREKHLKEERKLREEMERLQEEERLKEERKQEEEKQRQREEQTKQDLERQKRIEEERKLEEEREREAERETRREQERLERDKQIEEQKRRMEEKREKERQREEQRLREEREKERLRKEKEMEEERLRIEEERQREKQRLRQEREKQEMIKKEREIEEKRRIEEEERLRREREKQERLKKEREMEERRLLEEQRLRQEREKEERLKKEREMEERKHIEEEERLRQEREMERIRKEREMAERRLLEEQRLRQEKEKEERLKKEREMEERRLLEEQRLRQEREKEERLKKEREMEQRRHLEEQRLRQEREKEGRLKKEREMEERRLLEEQRFRQEREKEERLKKEREMEERRLLEEQRFRQEREKEETLKKEREMEERRLLEEQRLRQEKEKEEKLKKEREMEEKRLLDEQRLRLEREKEERLKKEREMEERQQIEVEERLRREREMERIRKEREMEERRLLEEQRLRQEREKEERLKKEREMEEKRLLDEKRLRLEREKEERLKKEREMEERQQIEMEERLRREREMERIRKEREMEERRQLEEQRLRKERKIEERLKKEREMEEKRLLEEQILRVEREKERQTKEKEMEEKRQIEDEQRLRQQREMERLQKKLREEREEKLKQEREMEERRRVEDEKRWRQEREKARLRMERDDVAVRHDLISFDGDETQSEVSSQLPSVLYDDFSVKPRRWGTGSSRSSTPSPSGEAQSDDAVHGWSNDPESPGPQKPQNSAGEDHDTCYKDQTETDSETHRSTPDHVTSQQMQNLGDKVSEVQTHVSGWVDSVRRSLQETLEFVSGALERDGAMDEDGERMRSSQESRLFSHIYTNVSGEVKNCADDDDDDEDDEEEDEDEYEDERDTETRIPHESNNTDVELTSQEKQRKPSIRSDAPEITEPEPLLFPKSSAPLLDSSVFRSKADLGKKRSIKRSRPSRAVRQRAALPALIEGSNLDWRFCDSSDGAKAQNSESGEEPSKYATPPPAPSRPKRVPVFPGMDQSALMAQLKRRSGLMETDVSEGQTTPTMSARSPRTPTLGPRVLPPVNSRNTGSGSSPSWLRELKSKKRLSRPESDA